MTLLNFVDNSLKEAMLSKDSIRTEVLRDYKTQLVNFMTLNRKVELTKEIGEQILVKMKNRRQESINQYSEAGRLELVIREEAELAIIESMLPKLPSEIDIMTTMYEWISENHEEWSNRDRGFFIPKNEMGKVIKAVKGLLPLADGKLVSQIVKEHLL